MYLMLSTVTATNWFQALINLIIKTSDIEITPYCHKIEFPK